MKENVSFWLYRISLNKSINYLKRSQNILFRSILQIESLFRHDRDEVSSDVPHSDYHPEMSLEAAEQQDLLTRAVASLPAAQQKVFALFYYEELSYKEISNVTRVVSLVRGVTPFSVPRENVKKKCCPARAIDKEIKT
ncbi:MAG: sigma-70 family RNA polymerase sigma factor [Bacteroidales bacterium]